MKTPKHALIIADSSGLVSIINSGDANHERATRLSEQWVNTEGSLIVPDAVFIETVNLLGKKFGHNVAVEAGNTARSA